MNKLKSIKKFTITWEGEYDPPTEEDISNSLLLSNIDDLGRITVKEKK